MTRSVAAAMQTIATVTVEASAGAQETTRTLHGMVELSERLNSGISQFKITDDALRTALPVGANGGSRMTRSSSAGKIGLPLQS